MLNEININTFSKQLEHHVINTKIFAFDQARDNHIGHVSSESYLSLADWPCFAFDRKHSAKFSFKCSIKHIFYFFFFYLFIFFFVIYDKGCIF